MADPIQEVKQKQVQEWTQEQIHEELTQLQQWEQPIEGQTREEQRRAHRALLVHGQQLENDVMQNAAQLQMPQAQAQAAAPGAPVQEQAPAQLTYKERRERRRRERSARRHVPNATAETYDMMHAANKVVTGRKNALENGPPANGVDTRVLGTFCQGYRCNKKGRPASPEDQRKADADNAFLAAYTSKDLEQRRPYLQRFYQELMNFPITGDTVSENYIAAHTEQLKNIFDRACYFENVMNDPINKPFFDELTPTEREVLSKKLDAFAPIGNYFNNYLGSVGVNANSGEYYEKTQSIAIPGFRAVAEATKDQARELAVGWKAQQEEILRTHTEEDLLKARDEILADLQRDAREQVGRRPEDMNFARPAAGYATEELKRYRNLIESKPQVYAAHREVIHQLYHMLYKGMDILNDMALDGMIYQSVVDEKNMSDSTLERKKSSFAFQHLEDNLAEMSPVQRSLTAITEALDFYLKGRKLTEESRGVLNGIGRGPEAEALEQEREKAAKEAQFQAAKQALQTVLDGDNGVLAHANQAYQSEKNLNAGLTALGARTSSSEYAKADKLLRGSTYVGYGDQMAVYILHLQNDEHTDMSAVLAQANQKYSSGMGGGVAGGPMDEINKTMFRNFAALLRGEESIRYIRTLSDMLKGADMFGNSTDGSLAYVVQSLMNSYGANFAPVGSQPDKFTPDTVQVTKNACRTLMSLSSLNLRSDEENAGLPEATKELLGEYRQLLRELKDRAFPPEQPGA